MKAHEYLKVTFQQDDPFLDNAYAPPRTNKPASADLTHGLACIANMKTTSLATSLIRCRIMHTIQ